VGSEHLENFFMGSWKSLGLLLVKEIFVSKRVGTLLYSPLLEPNENGFIASA